MERRRWKGEEEEGWRVKKERKKEAGTVGEGRTRGKGKRGEEKKEDEKYKKEKVVEEEEEGRKMEKKKKKKKRRRWTWSK